MKSAEYAIALVPAQAFAHFLHLVLLQSRGRASNPHELDICSDYRAELLSRNARRPRTHRTGAAGRPCLSPEMASAYDPWFDPARGRELRPINHPRWDGRDDPLRYCQLPLARLLHRINLFRCSRVRSKLYCDRICIRPALPRKRAAGQPSLSDCSVSVVHTCLMAGRRRSTKSSQVLLNLRLIFSESRRKSPRAR